MKESRAIAGINAILGALVTPNRGLDRVFVLKGKRGSRFQEIREAARRAGVPVVEVDRSRLDRMTGGVPHQGVAALAAAATYAVLEDLILSCEPAGRLIILDGVEDPRNLGAVIRTAAGANVRGVVVPEHRSAGLTPGAERAAAGTLASVAVAKCRNVADLAEELRERGFWVAGLAAEGKMSWDRATYPAKMALILGGEAKGLRPRVRKSCDELVSIPLARGVESLNLSVAAAVVLYEAVRQERAANRPAPSGKNT